MSEKFNQAVQAVTTAASAPAASVPPATIAAATFFGHQPSEWLVMLSIAWILVQFVALVTDRILRLRKLCKKGSNDTA